MLKTNNNIIEMKLTMPLMNAEIGFTMEDSLEWLDIEVQANIAFYLNKKDTTCYRIIN